MQPIDLFQKNLEYMDRCVTIQKVKNSPPTSVYIEEDQHFYDVILDNREKRRIFKREDFDFETFLQGEKLEICNLKSINVYHILATIIRSSEYCGFDNIVYLHYTDILMFYAMACFLDLEKTFSKNQFYVYFNDSKIEKMEQNNFLCCNASDGKKLQIEEMNTLVLFYQPQSCGWQFFRDIIKRSSYVIYADGWSLHRRIEEIEDALNQTGEIKRIFLDKSKRYKCQEVVEGLRRYIVLLSKSGYDYDKILNCFMELFFECQAMTISDIFKGLLISKYYIENGMEINKRVMPVIVYFPDHYQRFMVYYENIQKSFARVLYFRTVRNPVTRVVRAYEHMCRYKLYNFVKYLDVLFEEFYYDEYSIKSGYPSYAVKFEDLKQEPKKYMGKICDCFGIPYEDVLISDEKMFRLDALTPVVNKELFSESDMRVLEKLFSSILKHYKYADLHEKICLDDFNEHHFSFEAHMAENMNIDKEFIHLGIKSRLEKLKEKGTLCPEFPTWVK